jgi:peroxiredoxin
MTRFLCLAGGCHLLMGAFLAFWLSYLLGWLGLAVPNYHGVWQIGGAVLASLGAGFIAASINPLRHWPIALVGLLSSAGVGAGLVLSVTDSQLGWAAGCGSATYFLACCVPFGLVLNRAYKNTVNLSRKACPEVQEMALRIRTNKGTPLLEMSRRNPLLMVFLRHAGCPFCREALAEIAFQRRRIEATGTQIVLVHMGTDQDAHEFFHRYGLFDLPRVSDGNRTLYRAFGLGRGGIWEVFGPSLWRRGFEAAILGRNGIGWPDTDMFQMPGIFLIFHGQVLRSFVHQSAADRPNYAKLVELDGLDTNSAVAS